uniref:RecQ-mediated genome instability protein 1 n=1 Tax=Setaria digitata TaxID=48799 RepID=A0A915PUC6_9BILA
MDLEFIRDFFNKKLNIALHEEWLTEVVIYLRSLDFDGDSLLSAVYEQWLYTDLKISTKPLLCLSINDCSKQKMLGGSMVVQINSIIDIGTSLYSQYKSLTNKFEDNSGFQFKSEEGESNSDSLHNSKRMLSMEVTDGKISMRAVEYSPVNGISLLTLPGCKILLTKNICFRRGILLLTEVNCIVLGGDDDLLMKTGRPVEVMMKHLNIDALPQRSIVSLNKREKEKNRNDTLNANNSFSSESNTKPIMEVKPLSEEKSSAKTPRRKVVAVNGTARIKESLNSIRQQVNASYSESPSSSVSRMPVVVSTPKRSKNSSSDCVLAKRIKTEVVDDDNDIIVIENPTPVKEEIKEERAIASQRIGINLSMTSITEDPIITAYKKLGIESIATVLQSMRYALGPRRKILAALMETIPLEPLHINNDGMWALAVALSDESYECLTCLVSHKFLVELIGWTPEEALDARASKDPARRKEGTLRTRSAGQSMRRLDLIWEVEFFPPGGSTPIIHRIDTYAQKFGLVR